MNDGGFSSHPRSLSSARELSELRKLYGAKFSAITAALGHASEALGYLENDEADAAEVEIREVVRVLADA